MINLIEVEKEFIKTIVNYLLSKALPENEKSMLIQQLNVFSQPSVQLLTEIENKQIQMQQGMSTTSNGNNKDNNLSNNQLNLNLLQNAVNNNLKNIPQKSPTETPNSITPEKKKEINNGFKTANAIFNNFSNLITGVQKFVSDRNSPKLAPKNPAIEKKLDPNSNKEEQEKTNITPRITQKKLGEFFFFFI